MSWRSRCLNNQHREVYKNFGTTRCKRRLEKTYDTGVYRGTYGFAQKHTKTRPFDKCYAHFNVRSTKMTMGQTRCGVIAFNASFTKVLCVVNKTIYDSKGIEHFGLPKGHMEYEKDRTYSICASREFFEETGVRYKLLQNKHVYKRINNTIYYPVVISENQPIKPIDETEILRAEWKSIDELLKEGVNTSYHNQDLKVFLYRYLHDSIKLAKINNGL